MEGWFWRFTDRSSGRVVVALCGINEHADGDWATVAVAVHPGGAVRSAAADGAVASSQRFVVSVPGVLRADARSLEVELSDVRLAVELHDLFEWPLTLGGGGVFSALPFLGQYWHPHVLGGRVTGEVTVGDETWTLDGADVYAEKNWGAGFPDRWWWGQAQGFVDRDICVAFGGGRLRAGPVGADVTGCVLRLGDEVVRFSPPFALVRTQVGAGTWQVRARRRGWRVAIDAQGGPQAPAVLPVPIPRERRNVDRDLEHLGGRLRLRAWKRGSLVVDDTSELAGLEVGSTDPSRAQALATDHGVPGSAVS
jgi:tocopherol cyclase